MLTPTALPAPTSEELAQSARVDGEIRRRIADAGGWIPFSRFMDAALYAPGLGYYATERPIFGSAGDFITAPELSPLYAACLANGIADLLAKSGGGDVVEFGAGSGCFALHVLDALQHLDAPVERYRIVEPSAALAARQRQLLESHAGATKIEARLEWLIAPPPETWSGVAFANEVVDALPVDRFRVTQQGVEKIGVVAAGEGFAWQPRPADAALFDAVESLQRALPSPLPAGFVSELRPGQRAWIAGAAASLARGALLVVDYGLPRAQYYHPSRDGGTLCAFRRHRRVEDVLSNAGLQDLTAWVDFSALADDARAAGLEIGGFATQAHYLIAAGIEHELARLTEFIEERDRAALRQFAATMMLPGEMGERFKVMALLRGVEGRLCGFGFRDLSASL